MDSKKIGEYIQIKRKEKGLTQSQLGDILGVTSKAVSKWETGVAIPDVSLFPEVTKVLNITIEELLKGEDDKVIPVDKKKNYIIFGLVGLLSLLIILFVILFIYFKDNYSKVEIYKIESANNNFQVDGTLMNINGKSYLSIKKVKYISNEVDKFDLVYDFQYELYFDEVLLYKSTRESGYILKNNLSLAENISLIYFYDSYSFLKKDNDSYFVLRIFFFDQSGKLVYIDTLLNII